MDCYFTSVSDQSSVATTQRDVSFHRYITSHNSIHCSGYACRSLLNALAPLIGAEMAQGNKAVQKGWADDASKEAITELRTSGISETNSEMRRIIESTFSIEYSNLFRRRLALRQENSSDKVQIFEALLEVMERQELDFHGTFRKLAFFRPDMLKGDETDDTSALETFIAGLLSGSPAPARLDTSKATEEWLRWLSTYAARIESERTAPEWASEADFDEARKKSALAANPRFVLRQWVLEEVIKKVEADPDNGKHVLAKVMKARMLAVVTDT